MRKRVPGKKAGEEKMPEEKTWKQKPNNFKSQS